MKNKENLNENRKEEFWQSFYEPDVTNLRNKLKVIMKLTNERLENYSMNTSFDKVE